METETVDKKVQRLVASGIPSMFNPTFSPGVRWKSLRALEELQRDVDDEVEEHHVVALLSAFSGERIRTGMWVCRDMRYPVELALFHLLDNPRLTVPTLGTGWRLMAFAFSDQPTDSYIADGCLENWNTPIEVQAYGKSVGASYFYAECLLEKAQEKYPDTVGLPEELVYQIVSAQPVPDAWFRDVFQLPAGVRLLAPGLRKDEE